MPKVQPKETHEHYIKKCMSSEEMQMKHPNQKERYAVCENLWKKSKAEIWINDLINKENICDS